MQEERLLTQRGIPDRQPRLDRPGPDLARSLAKAGPRPFQAEPPSWLKVHGFASFYFHGGAGRCSWELPCPAEAVRLRCGSL